jgi:hypothetical protein
MLGPLPSASSKGRQGPSICWALTLCAGVIAHQDGVALGARVQAAAGDRRRLVAALTAVPVLTAAAATAAAAVLQQLQLV